MNLATIKPSTIKQGALKRRVLAVVSAAGMAAVALLPAMPASATEADGDPRMKCVQQDPYFFHGVSGQQGGFSTDAPTSPVPAAQVFPNGFLSNSNPMPLGAPWEAASWADSFRGDLCGQATVTVYLASPVKAEYVLRKTIWYITVVADGDDTIARPKSSEEDAFPPQALTVSFPLEAAVAENLEFRVSSSDVRPFAFLYDSPDYAAGFTVSTLQPCEVNDPHPDCVEAGFAELVGDVTGFADTGEVTADGETHLLAALEEAETAYGDGDNAQAVTRLEHFQQLAADPALVPGDPARDHLTAAASDLIAALEASEPA